MTESKIYLLDYMRVCIRHGINSGSGFVRGNSFIWCSGIIGGSGIRELSCLNVLYRQLFFTCAILNSFKRSVELRIYLSLHESCATEIAATVNFYSLISILSQCNFGKKTAVQQL